ncbi:MAG: YhdT family protein [Candidatus Oceanisphaera merdipullorum]|nr:YhdT family protein [Candidatus Oceanisphaera merdipullorum]
MNKIVAIAHREAALSVGLALLYMLSWWGCAYWVPAELTWGGWPLWFLLSCLFNPLLFIGLCALMIKRYFKNVALDTNELTYEKCDAINTTAVTEANRVLASNTTLTPSASPSSLSQ